MELRHVENLFRRLNGGFVDIKTISGGVYEGTIIDVTGDYVVLSVRVEEGEPDEVVVLLHTIESILPRGTT